MLNVEKNLLLVSLSVAVALFWFCRVAWRVDSATLMSRHYWLPLYLWLAVITNLMGGGDRHTAQPDWALVSKH